MTTGFANEIIENIWKDRYRKNGESLTDNFRRVAAYVAKNKNEEDAFFDMMNSGLFYPAGRTMSNAGIGQSLTMNNCFVAPQIEDSLEDIFAKVALGARTHQKGGGIGYDFSNLRPKGMPTSNDAIASGAVSFMDVFNAQTATILQGNRRGANMGVMNVYAMDIEEFITAKSTDRSKLNHFNVSVMIDDAFLKAVRNNSNIYLHFPVYDKNGNIENNPDNWIVSKEISAKYIWDLITRMAYDNGEPGVFFYDNLNKDNNLWYTEKIVCSNPCAEYLAGTVFGEKEDASQFGGACNLGSLMLHRFVKDPFTRKARIDYTKLQQTIRTAVTMLDNIIDVNSFPDPIYENYQKRFRTIGLGATGLADMLVMMNIKYNTKQARGFVDSLFDFIACEAYLASADLAAERGAFEAFDLEKFLDSGYIKKHNWHDVKCRIKNVGIRNAKILSVAPCGTMSLAFGNNCSSGIEPIFSLEYKRKVKFDGQDESNAKIVNMMDDAYRIWSSDEYQNNPDNIVTKDVFVTALEMSVNDHVDMLGVIARHVDMSVSKTINIPTEYSFADTQGVYMRAHELGIKGCTIFRPNEIRQGIMITDEKQEEKQEAVAQNHFDTIIPISRKALGTTHGDTFCKKCACGTLYITVNRDDNGNVVEIFVNTDKGGVCKANIAAVSRLTSLAMRSGVKIDEITDQLKGIDCPACRQSKKNGRQIDGMSCADIIAKTIREFDSIKTNIEVKMPEIMPMLEETVRTHADACPECGATIRREGGCVTCVDCGWSKCSE